MFASVCKYISIYIKLCIYFSPRPRRCLAILYVQVQIVKGFEILILLRVPSTHPHILQKSGDSHSFRQFRRNPKIKTARVTPTFVALVPVAGAHLQQVCHLPPLQMPSCLSTADMNCQGVLGKAGSISQLSKGVRGSGSVLPSDTLAPAQAHTCTKPLFASCAITLGWRGTG